MVKCERCGKSEGEYMCAACNRVVCSDCKIIDRGKVFCLDHDPLATVMRQPLPQEQKPNPHKNLKELIYSDAILLAGVIVIYMISNFLISNLLASSAEQITKNFPQLQFVFVLLTYFESAGLYAVILLFIILIALIVVLRRKKKKEKNI